MGLLKPLISDHCPGFSYIKDHFYTSPKPFKFHSFLVRNEQFGKILSRALQIEMKKNPVQKLCSKLKMLKGLLKTLNNEQYNNITERTLLANKPKQPF